jgi:hypothetical protein
VRPWDQSLVTPRRLEMPWVKLTHRVWNGMALEM